jgi:hypothetical protein
MDVQQWITDRHPHQRLNIWRCADADMAPELVQLNEGALEEDEEGPDAQMAEEADEEFDEVEALAEELQLRAERRQQAAEDDVDFPDEIETPHDVPARVCCGLATLPHASLAAAGMAAVQNLVIVLHVARSSAVQLLCGQNVVITSLEAYTV